MEQIKSLARATGDMDSVYLGSSGIGMVSFTFWAEPYNISATRMYIRVIDPLSGLTLPLHGAFSSQRQAAAPNGKSDCTLGSPVGGGWYEVARGPEPDRRFGIYGVGYPSDLFRSPRYYEYFFTNAKGQTVAPPARAVMRAVPRRTADLNDCLGAGLFGFVYQVGRGLISAGKLAPGATGVVADGVDLLLAFQEDGAKAVVMDYAEDQLIDLPLEKLEELAKQLRAGKPVATVTVNGHEYRAKRKVVPFTGPSAPKVGRAMDIIGFAEDMADRKAKVEAYADQVHRICNQ